MSDIDEQQPSEQVQPAGDGSILGELRAMRDRKGHENPPTVDFDVPGYGTPSALVIRYQYPSGGYQAAVNAAQAEFTNAPDARIEGNADLLMACCASVLGRNRDGKLVELATNRVLGPGEIPNPPLKLGRPVAEALGIAVPAEVKRPGRFIVRHLFSPRAALTGVYDGDVALIAQGNAVYAWLAGAKADLDDELSGE